LPEFWQNEQLLNAWPSAQPWGTSNLGRTAGTLYLTNQRLIFDGRKGVEDHYTMLRDIAAVYPYGRWPRIRVVLHSGHDRYYYTLMSRMVAAYEPGSAETRDAALVRIWSAVVWAHGLAEPHRG
jgi:hypothetical protein